jgi:hypothetical protein
LSSYDLQVMTPVSPVHSLCQAQGCEWAAMGIQTQTQPLHNIVLSIGHHYDRT